MLGAVYVRNAQAVSRMVRYVLCEWFIEGKGHGKGNEGTYLSNNAARLELRAG